MSSPLLRAEALSVSIGGHAVCRDLTWTVDAGETWAILGRNGAGKSTLLNTLAGLHRQDHGTLQVGGHALPDAAAGRHARALARVRGYLAQHQLDPFASTVMETALVGRHPHLGRWDWESLADRDIAAAALAEVDLADCAERDVQTLSGGERQRLAVAQLLAQQPALFLLDEPLTHLDLSHQVAVMELFAVAINRQEHAHAPPGGSKEGDGDELERGIHRWMVTLPVGCASCFASGHPCSSCSPRACSLPAAASRRR